MNKSILISIIEFVIFLGIIVWGYNKMNNKLDVSEQNLKAYKNQAKNLELENGELIRVRDSYILEIDQLQEEFNVSKREVKDLQKKLNSSLAYISKMESNIRIDTINNVKDSIIYIDSTKTNIYFKYTDEWFSLEGLTKRNKFQYDTELYNINMKVPLKFGITDDYTMFIQSDNPYMEFGEINGAVIEGSKFLPKEKRWSWGIHGGIGIGYDLITRRLGIGPYLGVGIQYNF